MSMQMSLFLTHIKKEHSMIEITRCIPQTATIALAAITDTTPYCFDVWLTTAIHTW